jgi:hypothetical protein
MAFDALAHRIGLAEEHLVKADQYEAKGDLRFARQAARHAGHYYESAADEALRSSLDRARDLCRLAETAYLRGRTPVYVRKVRARIEALDTQIQERDARRQEFIDSLEAH